MEPTISTSPDESTIHAFQQQLLAWYDTFKHDLPWRGDPDPYHILVSEVMLQQTQADLVQREFRSAGMQLALWKPSSLTWASIAAKSKNSALLPHKLSERNV